MATLNDIRAGFLGYFRANGHEIVPSSPLVPFNDPTLLFTNSGMVQFKDVFTGRQESSFRRAATAQKCLRAGGKHNDLDNVGYTARHHTFFEMLGNFSFGDYFKERAIPLAWELVTREFGLPADRLLVTIFHEDDEAAEIWKTAAGLPESRIIRIATSDNFWMMGPTGPCGPCSEIFFDHGESVPGGPPGSPDEDGDRYVEIWNLVFMQFEQFGDGGREPLPRPSIDTGMGLERIGAVLQGTNDNYATDLFRSLIEASAEASGADPDGPGGVHHRVIADHLRAACFLVTDGVLPSNDGRGYVLRRILRRAMRHAHLLGAEEPLLWRLVPVLARKMGQAFPELEATRSLAEETLQREEIRFRETLARGLGLLESELGRLGDGVALPGEVAFRLFDTYGFPLDLTQDALRERGRAVDVEGFDSAMAAQKARSRAGRSAGGEDAHAALWLALSEEFEATEFLGYETGTAEARVQAIVKDGTRVDRVVAGEIAFILVNQTPFYAEAGGQVGDKGSIRAGDSGFAVSDTQRQGKLILHCGVVEEGSLAVGDDVVLGIEKERRDRVRANHSATHLLHEALRVRLGSHVAQRGSLVAPGRLRFDFSHPAALVDDDVLVVDAEVNGRIREDAAVEARVMDREAAMESGARALFGEKYGDEVRVVCMGRRGNGEAYSVELCGGTHVGRTGEIGVFKIVSEGAVAAGIRRVEALTGAAALEHLQERDGMVRRTASMLRVPPSEVEEKVEGLVSDRRRLEEEVTNLRRQLASGGGGSATASRIVNGVPFLSRSIRGVPAKELRGLVDEHRRSLPSGVIALVAESGGKAGAVVGVSQDLTARVSAVDLVRAAAEALGGKGGGGRPDLAQGGGPDAQAADAALAAVERCLESLAAGG